MTMSRLCVLAAFAATSLTAVPALAGGLAEPAPVPVVPVPVPPPPAPSTDWSGFYVGGQFATARLDYSSVPRGEESFDGTAYGVHVGYVHDFGRFVVGAEGAIDIADVDDSEGYPTEPTSLDRIMRLGVRAGFDAGRVLPYVSAGFARGSFSNDFAADVVEADTDGTFIGGGVEFAVSDRLSVGAEVIRHSFPDYSEDLGFDLDYDETTVTTLGLRGSFRF